MVAVPFALSCLIQFPMFPVGFLSHVDSQDGDMTGHSHSHFYTRSPHPNNINVVKFSHITSVGYIHSYPSSDKALLQVFIMHFFQKKKKVLYLTLTNVVLYTKSAVTAIAMSHPFCPTCDLPCHMHYHTACLSFKGPPTISDSILKHQLHLQLYCYFSPPIFQTL